jgi:hypothetical protein
VFLTSSHHGFAGILPARARAEEPTSVGPEPSPHLRPVGSYASLRVGGKGVAQWKSEVDPTFLFVFTTDDLEVIPVGHPDNTFAEPVIYLRATAGVLADTRTSAP